jgi:hypothetical protein
MFTSVVYKCYYLTCIHVLTEAVYTACNINFSHVLLQRFHCVIGEKRVYSVNVFNTLVVLKMYQEFTR